MFSDPELILHLALTGLVILAGLQDWKKREVSNWITIPLFFLGIVFVILRVGNLDLLPVVVVAILAAAWTWKWMGGADVKILIGLWGLWPAAALWCMVGVGFWGLALVVRGNGKECFPALTVMAFWIFVIMGFTLSSELGWIW